MTDQEPDATDGLLTNALGGVTTRDVLRVLRVLVLVVVVVPFLIYAVPQAVGASQSYVVLSGSMEPAISTGDVIVVDDVPTSNIEEGDVITFGGGPNEPPTTHRVVSVGESGGEPVFRTKGDNNEDPDASPVAASDVIGKVVEIPLPTGGTALFAIPYIGYVIEFVGTPTGFIALVVLPFGLLGVNELWNYATRPDGEDDTADGTVAEPTVAADGAGADADAEEEAAAFTVDSRYLTLLTAALVGGGAVAGQRAYTSEDSVLAVIAVAALTAGIVLAAFVFYGDDEADGGSDAGEAVATSAATATPAPTADGSVEGRLVPASVPAELRAWPRVEVDSAEALTRMAATGDSWVVEDEEAGERFLFADGVAYAAPVPDETDAPPADEESAPDGTADSGGASPADDGADAGDEADAGDATDADDLFEEPSPDSETVAELENGSGDATDASEEEVTRR